MSRRKKFKKIEGLSLTRNKAAEAWTYPLPRVPTMKVLLSTGVGLMLVLILAVVLAFTRSLEDRDLALDGDLAKR